MPDANPWVSAYIEGRILKYHHLKQNIENIIYSLWIAMLPFMNICKSQSDQSVEGGLHH